jgi:hypothetical protein
LGVAAVVAEKRRRVTKIEDYGVDVTVVVVIAVLLHAVSKLLLTARCSSSLTTHASTSPVVPQGPHRAPVL